MSTIQVPYDSKLNAFLNAALARVTDAAGCYGADMLRGSKREGCAEARVALLQEFSRHVLMWHEIGSKKKHDGLVVVESVEEFLKSPVGQLGVAYRRLSLPECAALLGVDHSALSHAKRKAKQGVTGNGSSDKGEEVPVGGGVR